VIHNFDSSKEISLYNYGEKKIKIDENYDDQTGFLIVEYDNVKNKWNPIYETISENENMIDSRLHYDKYNDIYYITYNKSWFENKKQINHMRYRTIDIDLINKKLILGNENDLLKSINYNHSEKNCVFDFINKENAMILYTINDNFSIIENDNLKKIKNIFFENLIKLYGENNIYMSLGTPIINYNNRKLGLGHYKIYWKDIKNKNTQLKEFIRMYIENIKNHYGVLYFMFFYEYDLHTLQLTRLSHAFIPTTDSNIHLPYNLVFPTGLLEINDQINIFYGEGDIRCKNFIISNSELESLLIPITNINIEDYLFILLQCD
jgi:hypothetical protein